MIWQFTVQCSLKRKSQFWYVDHTSGGSSFRPPRTTAVTGGSISPALGRERLQIVRQVIESTCAPSWMTKPPPKIGHVGYKPTGTQWKTFFCYYLVSTLIPLWSEGRNTGPDQERFQAMLENMMDLVQAILSISSYSPTPDNIELGELCMQRYLVRLQQLHPTIALLPNHHLSLHFGFYIRMYGPPHVSGAWFIEIVASWVKLLTTNKRSCR